MLTHIPASHSDAGKSHRNLGCCKHHELDHRLPPSQCSADNSVNSKQRCADSGSKERQPEVRLLGITCRSSMARHNYAYNGPKHILADPPNVGKNAVRSSTRRDLRW